MAWLFIDTHKPDHFRFGRLSQNGKSVRRMHAKRAHFLPALLAGCARWKDDLSGICVVRGPGSFSAIRTGVLYANLLSRLLRLPLFSISAEEAADLRRVAKRLEYGALRSASYVAPVYDREPNITHA